MVATDSVRRAARVAAVLACGSLLAPIGPSAHADDRGAVAFFVHQTSDRLTVIHPSASVRADVGEDTELSAGYDADIISAATVDVRTVAYRASVDSSDDSPPDVVAGASVRGFEEVRNGLSLGIAHGFTRTVSGNVGYRFSDSPDYVTNAASLGMSVSDDDKNRTGTVALSVAHDDVGRVGDIRFLDSVTSLGVSVGWSTLLSSLAVFDLLAGIEHQSGFLESPYRTVPVYAPGEPNDPLEHYLESVPDARLRGALQGLVRIGFTPHVFGRALLRAHHDDWGVLGATLGLGVAIEPHPDWLCSLDGRFYLQREAGFYRGRYYTTGDAPRLRTADRELAASRHVSASTRLEYSAAAWLGFTWRVNANAELTVRHYDDTPRLPEEIAIQTGLALVAQR